MNGIKIDPAAVYTESDVVLYQGFTSAELRRGRAKGELRCKEVVRGKRVYCGRWLLEWLGGPEAVLAQQAGGAPRDPGAPAGADAAVQDEPLPGLPQFVTLDQCASIVGRSKRALETYLYDPRFRERHAMPDPAIDGGGGRANEWEWDVIRPWLEKVFGRKLPERFPTLR